MPPIGLFIGGIDFSSLALELGGATEDGDPVAIRYGEFINECITFIIVAFAVFMLVKGMNSLQRKADDEAAKAPAEPSKDILLLQEIRDAIKSRGV